ncbi:MAG: hydroxyethylthiazole kinase-like uncharacterized protein yjeF [Methylophagaceae bacterium]|jgi:hydroxyethylthiazole kinase-like uncharacterized protein yjeF
MLNLPDELYTAEQIRELERIADKDAALSSSTLMTHAGASALQLLKQQWPDAKHILILSGIGNNGGDGFELARQATLEGYHVTVLQVGGKKTLTKTAAAAKDALLLTGTKIHYSQETLPAADVIVDAIFGTGINRAVEGEASTIIKALNKIEQACVLSIDIPSGLQADTGRPLGPTVNATITLSFIGLNLGLFTGYGPNYCGHVYFESLDIPSAIYDHVAPVALRINLEKEGERLVPRERTGHKGLYGHLLIIGGDDGMSGAARISAEAGARVGAGLISIATRTTHSALLNLTRPELMCHGIEDAESLAPLLRSSNALTLGPGLGQNDWGQTLFKKTVETSLPMVVDADALNLLSKNPQHRDHWILTPHPGEAARLLHCTTAEVQADRFNAVRELQAIYGGIIVLKGSGTLIYSGETTIRLSSSGNPGMGSGGMGDVLAGVIGGLLAQGFPLLDAACIGVALHGMAGDKAAEQGGERGMLAMDLMPYLRLLSNSAS